MRPPVGWTKVKRSARRAALLDRPPLAFARVIRRYSAYSAYGHRMLPRWPLGKGGRGKVIADRKAIDWV